MEAKSFQVRKFLAIERLVQLEDEELLLVIEHLLMPEPKAVAMSDSEFKKFISDRLRDVFDPAERVPGEVVLQKIRARLVAQTT